MWCKSKPKQESPTARLSLNVPILMTGTAEALLKLFVVLRNILKGQNIKVIPQNYGTTNNFFAVGALQFLNRNPKKRETK